MREMRRLCDNLGDGNSIWWLINKPNSVNSGVVKFVKYISMAESYRGGELSKAQNSRWIIRDDSGKMAQ
jgi:hypothetical protein